MIAGSVACPWQIWKNTITVITKNTMFITAQNIGTIKVQQSAAVAIAIIMLTAVNFSAWRIWKPA